MKIKNMLIGETGYFHPLAIEVHHGVLDIEYNLYANRPMLGRSSQQNMGYMEVTRSEHGFVVYAAPVARKLSNFPMYMIFEKCGWLWACKDWSGEVNRRLADTTTLDAEFYETEEPYLSSLKMVY